MAECECVFSNSLHRSGAAAKNDVGPYDKGSRCCREASTSQGRQGLPAPISSGKKQRRILSTGFQRSTAKMMPSFPTSGFQSSGKQCHLEERLLHQESKIWSLTFLPASHLEVSVSWSMKWSLHSCHFLQRWGVRITTYPCVTRRHRLRRKYVNQ